MTAIPNAFLCFPDNFNMLLISDGIDIAPTSHPATKENCNTPTITYTHGDTWRVSACQSCMCENGIVHCFSQTCPLLDCQNTVLKKGQCCPSCLGKIRHRFLCMLCAFYSAQVSSVCFCSVTLISKYVQCVYCDKLATSIFNK